MRLIVPILLTLLPGGCASSGAVPAPFPTPTPSAPAPAPEPSPIPYERAPDVPLPPVVGTALSLQGAPYRNGGSDPSGFDCSGFVAYVFAQQGLAVPRTVSEQYDAGREISPDAVEPGDLVFFSTVARGASHVGIAISADEFVHAPSSKGVVRVEHLSAPYWSSRFVGIRRVF
jgi:cell wall-associated NlpC family hydrolase